jgi:hypothetical protein
MSDEIVWLGSPPEPCRKVRKFSELRSGATIYAVDCGWCGETHRGILLNEQIDDIQDPYGITADGLRGFDFVPVAPCGFEFIDEEMDDGSDMYRVVDLKLEAETTTRTKSKAKPKETVGR